MTSNLTRFTDARRIDGLPGLSPEVGVDGLLVCVRVCSPLARAGVCVRPWRLTRFLRAWLGGYFGGFRGLRVLAAALAAAPIAISVEWNPGFLLWPGASSAGTIGAIGRFLFGAGMTFVLLP
jgi:hypothetical protein